MMSTMVKLRAGFDEVDDDDVQDLLESHAEPLSNDELIELDKASQEAEEGDKEEEPVRGLDNKTLKRMSRYRKSSGNYEGT
ncbi:hypothetical protein E2C01_037391 [Portunus trituberculatus]|uniref:Uncharacterized protein n=1 Tax=Portunus trituberculatus TaxID=210409 RepID=A0A5B7F811_PORTR|nr:hypothetical protein [Portunus trituberculatus]